MTVTAEKIENKAGYKKTELGWIPRDWDIKKIQDIAKINEKSLPENTNKEYEFTYLDLSSIKQGVIDFPVEKIKFKYAPSRARRILKRKDVIMATVRPYLQGFALADFEVQDVICSTGFALITPAKSNDSTFIYQTLYSNFILNQIDKLLVGSNYPAINSSDVENLKIIYPQSSSERQKIAKTLFCWDKAIEKTEELIIAKTQLKKALMQQLLMGKIRFGEFAGQKWIKVSLKDKFERITRKNTENNANILTISAQQGLISQEEFYKKRIASKDTSNYILIKNGEFAYNKSYSTGYPMGAIKRLDKYDSGVVSSLYICFASKSDDICSSFFAHYFEAGLLNQEIQNIAQEGARNHGLLNIGITEFFATLLRIPPSIEEQQKIATVLNACDEEIKLLNKQFDSLKEQKKGLMQKLLTGQIRVKVDSVRKFEGNKQENHKSFTCRTQNERNSTPLCECIDNNCPSEG
ncbi:MAG: Type I restriction-modification system specificity subunit S [uncultured bacterium]|nr:MAG: Type I restriction-modification system specificity subunit S [uncultured bacterium]HBH17896.1 restriction endonuclease subunit S [Cyanobacteria bacterium UBA9579]